jgi:hypothetical protein
MKKKVNKKNKVNIFKTAVTNTEHTKNCYRNGLQALGTHKSKVTLTDPSCCEGSVEIDACLVNKFPSNNRWDYSFSYKEEVFFVEVHSANTSEVSTVLRKLQWLKDWLNEHAPEINNLKATSKPPFYWLQSSGYHILRNSPQERLIVQKGLRPISKLTL